MHSCSAGILHTGDESENGGWRSTGQSQSLTGGKGVHGTAGAVLCR